MSGDEGMIQATDSVETRRDCGGGERFLKMGTSSDVRPAR